MSPLPEPIDLTHHLSDVTKARQASNIKDFYKYFQIPGIGQLAGGLPAPAYFPFDDLEAKVALPDRFEPTPSNPVEPPASQAQRSASSDSPPSAHLVVPKQSNIADRFRQLDLTNALQYMTAEGLPALVTVIKKFATEYLHTNVPYKGGPDVCLTCGNTDGFAKFLEAFNNVWIEGKDPISAREGILVEEMVYPLAVNAMKPRGLNVVPIALDSQGMKPSSLEAVLKNWDFSKGKRPHLMYTITIGQNPTGTTLSLERKKELYDICVRYDVMIAEDDPYWFLQYPSASKNDSTLPPARTGHEFMDSLVPSYLRVDYQGRVVRLDTFSKMAAPGCRMGFITAQPKIVERILRITESTSANPSGFVMSMIAELILGPYDKADAGRGGAKDGKGWEMSGFVRWLEGLRGNYERRMNSFCDELDKGKVLVKAGRRNSIGDDDWSVVETTQLFDFVRPTGGMFVWMRFDFSSHPLAKTVPHKRLARALWILWTTKPYLVLVAPGTMFGATPEVQDREAWKCFRLSFAAADEDVLAPLGKRTAKGAQDFWRIKSKERIDEILKDDNPSEGAQTPNWTDPALIKLSWGC